MATVAPIAPSWLNVPPAIAFLPRQKSDAPAAPFSTDVENARARAQGAKPDPRPAPGSPPPDPALVDGAGFRRRLGAVDPEESRETRRGVPVREDAPERRQRARQPTSPFPAGPSSPFLAQALTQQASGRDEAPEAAETTNGVAAYRSAAAFAEDLRISFFGPGEPLRLAA